MSKFIDYRNKFIANIIFKIDRIGYHNKILDLGCGEGILKELEKLMPRNYYVYKGIDIKLTKEQREISNVCRNVKFEEVDIEQFLLREKTEKYDFIVLQEVLEHLDRDKTIPVIFRTIFRLSVNGVLIVSVPNYKRLMNGLFGSEKKFMDDTHKFEFIDGELDNILRALDYKVVDKKYIVLYLSEVIEKYIGKLIGWKLREYILKINKNWASHIVYVCRYKNHNIKGGQI